MNKEEKKVYLTQEGVDELKKQLDELKNVKRPEVIIALKEARALGDLSENAEYDAARTEQALVEGKIQELEAMLENVEVIKERNIRSEYFKLDKLYKKMAFLLVNETSEKNEVKSTLYDAFEKEFGRTLSPNEYAIIGKLEESYTEELVLCALTEAVYNDVRNLIYIDHILAEWKRKGIKTKSDVENSKKEYKKIKKEKETKKLFDSKAFT